MKKTITILLAMALSIAAFAEGTWVHAGFNYGLTFSGFSTDGNVVRQDNFGLNLAFSGKSEYCNYYLSFGFDYYKDIDLSAVKNISGVKNASATYMAIPLRIGLPVYGNISESTRFVFIPCLAFDINFFKGSVSMNVSGMNAKCDVSGWGYSLGFAANIGMEHHTKKLAIRYGAEVSIPLMSLTIINTTATVGGVQSKGSDTALGTFLDGVDLKVAPYISVGFRFGK